MPDGERDGANGCPPVKDVRRLLMLIFEGWIPPRVRIVVASIEQPRGRR